MPNNKFIGGFTFADQQILTFENLNHSVELAEATPYLINGQTDLGSAPADIDELIINRAASPGVAGLLRKISVAQLFGAGSPITNISSITGKTDTDLSVNLSSGKKFTVNRDFNVDEDVTVGLTLTVTGKSTLNGGAEVNGYLKIISTDAMLLPVGTTAQRPATPVLGQLRYNSTLNQPEVYKGSTWEVVGGGPFDATGGNNVIAPDSPSASSTSATFTSADGVNVVVTSAGHSVVPGQVVNIVTAVTGYSGEWTVISANTNDFTYAMTIAALPNSGSCTYKKAGNYKIHIFTSSGTFVAGNKASHVEVFVVGGGGGGGSGGGLVGGGGGGGAVCYYPYYNINASETITVTVGSGGAVNANGSASIFGNITAGGGLRGYTSGVAPGGASGTGSIASASYAGGTNTGGGGGSRGAGGNGNWFPEASGGYGGNGTGSTISGIAKTYGGGGGAGGAAGANWQAPGIGMDGGGTSGTFAPVANSGGGGGGSSAWGGAGQAGAAGIVIVRYPYWV